MNNKDVSVLVNTCDKYEDAWFPFFSLFKKYWPNCAYDVYMNTETKAFSMTGMQIICLNSGNKKNMTWTRRLIGALRQIRSKYVIMMLEDFFFLDYVKQSEIDKAINWLDGNQDVSCFQFYPNPILLSIEDNRFPGYSKRDIRGKYWLRCQATLWRKADLLKYLNPYESAWQFEEYGTNVAKLYNKCFYNCCDKKIMPFVYDVDITTGYGLYLGQWLESNIALFEKEGIAVDFNKMGLWKNGVRKQFPCPVSRKTFKERIMYLFYGGGTVPYMSLKDQFLLLFTQPLAWSKMMCKKILYFITPHMMKKR